MLPRCSASTCRHWMRARPARSRERAVARAAPTPSAMSLKRSHLVPSSRPGANHRWVSRFGAPLARCVQSVDHINGPRGGIEREAAVVRNHQVWQRIRCAVQVSRSYNIFRIFRGTPRFGKDRAIIRSVWGRAGSWHGMCETGLAAPRVDMRTVFYQRRRDTKSRVRTNSARDRPMGYRPGPSRLGQNAVEEGRMRETRHDVRRAKGSARPRARSPHGQTEMARTCASLL